MILIDASVLVDYLRSPTERILRVFEENEAAICGVTRAEILAGARNPADLDRIARSLNVLGQVEIVEGLWDVLGRKPVASAHCRSDGSVSRCVDRHTGNRKRTGTLGSRSASSADAGHLARPTAVP